MRTLIVIVCLGAIFAFQANAAISSIKKPGAFNEAVTGTDKFIDICSGQAAYTLEDGKAAVIYTSGPLASATQMTCTQEFNIPTGKGVGIYGNQINIPSPASGSSCSAYLNVKQGSDEYKTCQTTDQGKLISISKVASASTFTLTFDNKGAAATQKTEQIILIVRLFDAGSDDNKDIKSEEAACTNTNTKWKDFIKEAASEVADEAACVAKCTADDNCQYGVWVATGTKCYLGQFDAASPVTVTEANAVTKIFYKNSVLDASPSPVDSKFEENCEFNGITPVYHKIVDSMTVGGEGECAAKCAVSCSGTVLCQFYKYDSCSKSCILGNFNKQGTKTPMVINDDNLPLSAIKVLKQDTAIIGKSLFDTTSAGACTDASTPITVTAGLNKDLGGTSKPANSATCKFFIEKPASLKGKVTLTLDSAFANGQVKVIIGRKDDTGVQICELTTASSTCEWFDSLAVVTWAGTAASPAGKVTVTYPAA